MDLDQNNVLANLPQIKKENPKINKSKDQSNTSNLIQKFSKYIKKPIKV